MFETYFHERLLERESKNTLRSLKTSQGIDFSSNDYLGYSRSGNVLRRFKDKVGNLKSLGSTGSRLLNGQLEKHHEIENRICELFNSQSALLFSSGYLLNLGLIQAIANEQTVIIMDELCHNSIKNGAKLSSGKTLFFRHNDVNHLEERLKRNSDLRCLIVIESVYSMDGDVAPLKAIVDLARTFNAEIVVDEAHAMGTIGPVGKGLVHSLGLSDQVLARIVTFGKAFGAEGAAVLGTEYLMKYLVNFCQSFIYTTGMSQPHLLMIESVLDHFQNSQEELESLHRKMSLFSNCHGVKLESPIFAWKIHDNDKTKASAQMLNALGYNIFPILSPTVRKGTERLRIVLHAFNSDEDIRNLSCEIKSHE